MKRPNIWLHLYIQGLGKDWMIIKGCSQRILQLDGREWVLFKIALWHAYLIGRAMLKGSFIAIWYMAQAVSLQEIAEALKYEYKDNE